MRWRATATPISVPYSALKRLGAALLDAALPPHCLTCEAMVSEQGTLCTDCFRKLSFIATPLCDGCGMPQPFALAARCEACEAVPHTFHAARAALLYDDGARALILPFKHSDRTELATPLAAHMARAGAALLAEADLLVPVPLHWWRLYQRRYNQSALLAKRIAARAGLPWTPDALRRTRATAPLGELGAALRREAVAGAFIVTARGATRIAGRRVLLVDDVLTSGATADACAAVLLAAGATSVAVLAAARVPPPKQSNS